MNLDEKKAIEILKNPKNKSSISEVKLQESKLRVFTEELSEAQIRNETYWGEFCETLRAKTRKKYKRIMDFCRFTLPIVQITDSILNDFFKVFDGKNKYFNFYSESNIDQLTEWEKAIDLPKWIQENAEIVFKNKPNSFVVVDIDQEGKPYLVFVDSNRIIDADYKNSKGQLNYIAFIHSQNVNELGKLVTNYSIYDDSTYFVFSKVEGSDSYNLILEEPHQIGYCPAHSFISTASNSSNYFNRRVAFSSGLSKLEDWSTFDIFRNYMDHYAPFPITEAPRKTCKNEKCRNGKEPYNYIIDAKNNKKEQRWKTCEVCKGEVDNGSHIGPGTHIGIKVSKDRETKDSAGIFRMIFPEIENLKYVPQKLQDLELEIKLKTTGVNSLVENEAMNEIQVKGSFVSMESVLIRTKEDLDYLYTWIIQTTGKIFNPIAEINVEANFGTEFYLISEDELQKRFDSAKKIGLPIEEQLNIYKQLIQTKYKGNSNKLERQMMLIDLDPLPLYSLSDTITLLDKGAIDKFQLVFKTNFLKLISRFESENIDITSFGVNIAYSDRIERIKETLYIYTEELIKEMDSRSGENKPVDDPVED